MNTTDTQHGHGPEAEDPQAGDVSGVTTDVVVHDAAGGLSALLVREDGSHEAIRLPGEGSARVAELQRLVGGFFDCVGLDPHTDMWVHDEGLFVCQPNPVASRLAAAHGFDLQPYYGPAVFTGGVDAQGDTLALRPQDLDLLAGMAVAASGRGELWDDVPDGHRFDEVHRRGDVG